jgi:predicted nucleic acid-binding protein
VVALLDSVAVAGFLDRDDAFHESADRCIRGLAGRDRLVVSVITYSEILTGAQIGHHDTAAARGFFSDLIDEILVVDDRVAERAADLRASKQSLKMPDALILATAGVHDVDLVVTADSGWPGVLGKRPRVELLSGGG